MQGVEMRIRYIDEETSRKFKALCQLEGKTLGEKLTELMQAEIKRAGLDKRKA